MEVKIKDGNGYVEADWTIEDGVMVVSQKKVKFEPKDGDVVTAYQGNHIFILENHLTASHGDCYCGWNFEKDELFSRGSYFYDRYATEEEKQKLFDRLAEEGWEFDFDKKELIKIKWRPKVNETFYYPYYNEWKFYVGWCFYTGNSPLGEDKDVQRGWCFKSKEECQAFCNKLNQAVSQVKP